MGLKANGQKAKGLKAKGLKAKGAEGEMKANPAAKLYKKESLAPKGELGIKRKAWRGGREELRLPTYGWRA